MSAAGAAPATIEVQLGEREVDVRVGRLDRQGLVAGVHRGVELTDRAVGRGRDRGAPAASSRSPRLERLLDREGQRGRIEVHGGGGRLGGARRPRRPSSASLAPARASGAAPGTDPRASPSARCERLGGRRVARAAVRSARHEALDLAARPRDSASSSARRATSQASARRPSRSRIAARRSRVSAASARRPAAARTSARPRMAPSSVGARSRAARIGRERLVGPAQPGEDAAQADVRQRPIRARSGPPRDTRRRRHRAGHAARPRGRAAALPCIARRGLRSCPSVPPSSFDQEAPSGRAAGSPTAPR